MWFPLAVAVKSLQRALKHNIGICTYSLVSSGLETIKIRAIRIKRFKLACTSIKQ